MSDTPVFDTVWESNRFTVLPTEYTDRITPETTRQQGYQQGYSEAIAAIIAMLKEQKPTRANLNLIEALEKHADAALDA